jgi:ubiquinone biosynthesis monooxygenase Coq7
MMHTQNQAIFDTGNPKQPLDILSILPMKKTRDRLKTQMLRVDHAGELGAVHIYRGQATIFQSSANTHDVLTQVQAMGEHEKIHLNKFNDILPIRRIRPSLLSPFWQTGGFLMGAMTALVSEKSAMACTEAVETVIDSHYDTQINYFTQENTPDILLSDLKQFQQDELAHKHEAIASDAHNAPFYKTTRFLIETLCHCVIKLAHKV